jgi:hypothetical protein
MTYEFIYDGESMPKWVKVLTASSGEELRVSLVYENEEDRLALTVSQAYQHIDNFIQYIKDTTSGMSSIPPEGQLPDDGWPFNGNWGQVERAKEEVLKWWSWAYYNDDFETSEA